MQDKSVIYEYLKKHKYMALATASPDAKPEVATVEYVVEGDDLLINTLTDYRKYANLINNPQVSGVITTDHDMTLQFDAVIKELQGDDASYARQKLLDFDPSFADFFDNQATRFFRITPTWLRLRDYTGEQLKEIEHNNK